MLTGRLHTDREEFCNIATESGSGKRCRQQRNRPGYGRTADPRRLAEHLFL